MEAGCNYEGDNADEVAIATAAEYGQETPSDQEEHSQDELSQDEIDEDEAPANRITIKSPKDLEDVLNSPEHNYFETDSNSLSLVFQLRKLLASERIQAASARQRRLRRSTLDAFIGK